MAKTNKKEKKLIRKHKFSITLNSLELDALNKYCKKYKVSNKSKFMRETIVKAILIRFDKDYPVLFPEFEEKEQINSNQGTLTM